MSNSLIKGKKYYRAVVGQPYVPATPARKGWVNTEVCSYKFPTTSGGGGTNNSSGGTSSNANGSTSYTVNGTYSCKIERVQVDIPASPGQPYIAARKAYWDYFLGWNAGARSLSFVTGECSATFQVRATTVGAVVGLSHWEAPQQYSGITIAYGFYLSRGQARVMELGSFSAVSAAHPFTSDTVFKIERIGGSISYYMDDELVLSRAMADDEPMWLYASLYAGDDEVFNPQLNQLSEPDLSPVTGALALKIPPSFVAFGNRTRLRLRLPPPKIKASYGMLGAPSFSVLNLSLPPAVSTIYGLVGAVGQLNLKLPPANMFLSDRELARLKLKLPVHKTYGRSWPLDELPNASGLLLTRGSSNVTGIGSLPAPTLRGVLTGSAAPYAEITLSTVTIGGILSGSIDPQGEVTLPTGALRAVLTGSVGVLSGVGEVFVMNLTGGDPGGTTQYDGYTFNSFACIGGRYFGASEEGLFLLEGDSDTGKPIAATFGFGQSDFGTPQLKTASYCYLGAAAGAMTLKVDALVNGSPASFTYPARGHGASMREVRFDLGRGLRSTYITPTFSNQKGEPFEVDTVSFVINESTRRI